MNPISEEPILADEEASISSQSGSTSSKKWKKSTFIFGGIMGLVVLIPIVFSIVNMVENSSLNQEVSDLRREVLSLRSDFEWESEKAKTMEANQKKIQSQLELEIDTRKAENATLSNEIEKIKIFVNYTSKYF